MSDPNAHEPTAPEPFDPAAGAQPQSPPQQQQQPTQQQPYAQQPPPGSESGYAQPGYAQPSPPLTAENDKLWASLSHFGGIIGPVPVLIIWLVLKDRGQRTNVEGKEALNWQITFTIGYVILWIVSAILIWIPFLGLILWLLPLAWWILNVVFSILGGVKVQGGGSYRYPINVRFIK